MTDDDIRSALIVVLKILGFLLLIWMVVEINIAYYTWLRS